MYPCKGDRYKATQWQTAGQAGQCPYQQGHSPTGPKQGAKSRASGGDQGQPQTGDHRANPQWPGRSRPSWEDGLWVRVSKAEHRHPNITAQARNQPPLSLNQLLGEVVKGLWMEMRLLVTSSHTTLSASLAVFTAVESKVIWPCYIRADPEHKQPNPWEGRGKLAEIVGVHWALILAIQTDYIPVVFFLGNIYTSYISHIYEASKEQVPPFAACWAFPKAQPYQALCRSLYDEIETVAGCWNSPEARTY